MAVLGNLGTGASLRARRRGEPEDAGWQLRRAELRAPYPADVPMLTETAIINLKTAVQPRMDTDGHGYKMFFSKALLHPEG